MKNLVIEKIAIAVGIIFVLVIIVVMFIFNKKEKNDIQKEVVIDEIVDVEEKIVEEEIAEFEEVENEKESIEEFKEAQNLSSLEKDIEPKEFKESEKSEEKEEKTIDNTLSKKDTIKKKKSKKILFLKDHCYFFNNINNCTEYHTNIYSFDPEDNNIEKIYELGETGNGYLFEPENKKVFYRTKSGGVAELSLVDKSWRLIIKRDYNGKVTDMLIEDGKLFYLSGSCGENVKSDCILQYIDMSTGFNKFIASDIKSEELNPSLTGIVTLGSYDKSKKSLYFLNSMGKKGIIDGSYGSLYKINIENGIVEVVGRTGDDGYYESIGKHYSMELNDNREYCYDKLGLVVDLGEIAKISSRGSNEGPHTIYTLLGCVNDI
ncbi:MAG: hypothetical protein KAT32_01835 [Candidatus Moranbacteria bacterium]|nr:hypothetical protein [Candidatus Moranbacteria bacterium]